MPIKSQVGKESVLVYSVAVDFDESSNCSEQANTFGVHSVQLWTCMNQTFFSEYAYTFGVHCP